MSKEKHLIKILLYILVISLPAIISVVLLRVQVQASYTDLVPHWSDEVYYWQQISSFRSAGLSNGYFTVNEQPAPATFTHYYAWGPVVPAAYALLSLAGGWSVHSMPLVNLIIFSTGIAIYLFYRRPDKKMLFAFALVVTTPLAFYMYYYTSLLTVMELGIAIGLSAGLYTFITQPTQIKALILLVVITLLSLFKITWALLAIPVLILILRRRTPIRILGVTLSAGLYIMVLYLVSVWMSAPYPTALTVILSLFQTNLSQGFAALINYTGRNFVLLSQGTVIEILQRLQLVVLTIGLIIIAIKANRQLRHRTSLVLKQQAALTLKVTGLCLFLIISTLLVTLVAYDTFDWREFRVTAPVLMMVMVLMVAINQYRIAGIVVGIAILATPVILSNHQERVRQWVNSDQLETLETWQITLKPFISYDSNAVSPWCNTVYHSISYFDKPQLLMAFEPGIGLSFHVFDTPSIALNSQWLLLDNTFIAQYSDDLSLEYLLSTPNGSLYRNLDAKC